MRSQRTSSTTPRRLAPFALPPIIAIAIAIIILTWGPSSDSSEAATFGAAMSMSVDASQTAPCPVTKVSDETCIKNNQKFDVIVSADAIPTAGYTGAQAWIQYGVTGLVAKGVTLLWPDSDGLLYANGDTGSGVFAGALTSIGPVAPPSFNKTAIFGFSFTCTAAASQHVLVLEPIGGPNAGASGSGYTFITTITPATGPNLLINCLPPKLPYPGDTDGDGCADVRENLPKAQAASGGGRSFLNPWDYYDVASLSGPTPDGVIDLLYDILGVVQHYAPMGAPPYDVHYDRGPTTGPNPWNMTAPDGVIDLLNDILGVVQQFQHNC